MRMFKHKANKLLPGNKPEHRKEVVAMSMHHMDTKLGKMSRRSSYISVKTSRQGSLNEADNKAVGVQQKVTLSKQINTISKDAVNSIVGQIKRKISNALSQ